MYESSVFYSPCMRVSVGLTFLLVVLGLMVRLIDYLAIIS